MSREQWGHGYHKGVKDGQRCLVESLEGWSRKEIELITEYCIAQMYYRRYVLTDYGCHRDISCYPVEWFYADFGDGDNIPEPILDVIYKYIWKYRPYNTQITGPNGDKSIEEDEIRVYGYLPEKMSNYKEWSDNTRTRMKPIFNKIEDLWWAQAGIKERET